jgi:hypothetical protein
MVGTTDLDPLLPSELSRAGIGIRAFEAAVVLFEPGAIGTTDIGLVEADPEGTKGPAFVTVDPARDEVDVDPLGSGCSLPTSNHSLLLLIVSP